MTLSRMTSTLLGVFSTYATAALSVVALPDRIQAAGVVGTGTPGSCTETALEAALAGGGTVTFNCGAGAVVIPITSTKILTSTTTINGAGQQIVLDGGNATRLFRTTYQFSSFTLTFRNLTMRNARTTDVGAAIRLAYQDYLTTLNIENVNFTNNVCAQAGADVGGGAIYAQGGYVFIRNSVFTGNRGGNGGAIGNLQARLTIEDSVFSSNATHATVGGSGGGGGAIYIDGSNNGLVTIRRSSFIGNTSTGLGGAIHTYQYAGSSGVIIEDSTFQGNETYHNGGAIYHQNGRLTVTNSTFANNVTVGQGGAIWLLEANPVNISNSTFTGNRANGVPGNDSGNTGLGGAILINASSVVTLSHLTIVNNHADWVGGGICGGMGSSTTTLRASIVANNTSSTGIYDWNIGKNCSDELLDGGFNLQYPARDPRYYNDSNCTAVITIAEPAVAPLADNGGPTQTHALLAGSPARDAVTSGCPPPSTDQRGVARPHGSSCDIGAYEAAPRDFDGDGVPDILWRNASTGQNALWYMQNNGTSIKSSAWAPAAATTWIVGGIANFDGDGVPDILWRNGNTGKNAIWYMQSSGKSIKSSAWAPTVATAWIVGGIADFDGDGVPDILWRNGNTGKNAIWYMQSNGKSVKSSAWAPTVTIAWVAGKVADFDGDGVPDILWRDPGTGQNAIWYMQGNGRSVKSSAWAPTADTNWEIGG